jgi:hypothetical protein
VMCCSHAESYSVHISLGHDFLGCRRGGLAIGRAAAGSPGTLLVACTAEMWLEILDRTAEN